MFLRATTRKKDGKVHCYYSVVENRRVAGGRVVQRHVLYLGEINASQERAWRRSIEVIEDGADAPRTVALFPEDRVTGLLPDASIVTLKLAAMRLVRPRQWGACWLALTLWQTLDLDVFFAERLAPSRKGTRWDLAVFVLAAYRLISPGSEWRLHREWYGRTALCDLLGTDEAIVDPHVLYRAHDRLLAHKVALFSHLTERWRDLFNAAYEVLLYDLTSTYFESDPPLEEHDKRRHGYSRDHRPDCVQIVIALIVTAEGLPIAYEVLPGNTADSTTLRGFLQRIEHQYGRARRIWCMDRGIPTEAVLAEMRASDPPVQYLVGTPKGRLNRLESALVTKPWREARAGVKVKLLPEDGELYVYAESHDRIAKERAMRKRQLKWLWARLAQLSTMELTRDALLMKLGSAQTKAPAAWRLLDVTVDARGATFRHRLNKVKLRQVRRREGRYLLRTNLTETDPVKLWHYYLQLVQVEEAFRTLKHDLAIRPIYHQHESRIEAHVFLAFLAYCLYVTLGRQLKALAPGLTARSALEKFAAVTMVDVKIPTTDGRELMLTRYTEPERELQLLLERLKLVLPPQPKPKITAAQAATAVPL
ncbi:MAG: IS1634 family transposase ISVsp2 [Steroidobacteraceae bacterium]|nr:IS1634 family transposase ISVsp2 [Steroidobacteraceae bacterium]